MNKEQLTNWRESIELNKTQMARYLGVPVNTYLQWERGDREMTAAPIRLISVLSQVEMLCPDVHNILINQAKYGEDVNETT